MGGREGERAGRVGGRAEGEGGRGGMVPLCIAMRRNILVDRWRFYFNVMASMEWVHIAWNGCIIGNLSEAG